VTSFGVGSAKRKLRKLLFYLNSYGVPKWFTTLPPSCGKPQVRIAQVKGSEKRGLSVYALGRFPVTLYREQWEKLLGMADEIRSFIRENDGALKKKE
jgi:hypothetical protein